MKRSDKEKEKKGRKNGEKGAHEEGFTLCMKELLYNRVP